MPELAVVKSLITPHDQTLRKVFNAQRSYFIDIYQREYRWNGEQVNTLLGDIEDRFLQHDFRKTNPRDIQEDVLERFEPYFLNTFLTHTTAANTSIVDGQQRLTTLLLIFIKLYRILKTVEENAANRGKTFASLTLEQLIFENDDFGNAQRFKIFNENREDGFRTLIEGRSIQAEDETRRRIGQNFELISGYLEAFFKREDGEYDLVKITYYIAYLLDLISIVEIRIERQDNVAMIFEVVNDRGLGLRPYEILKGKLIGGLAGAQKEKANRVWTDLQEQYFRVELKNSTEKKIDLDLFFQTFFRAKFASNEKEYEAFEGDYHKEMYRNQKVREFFGQFQDRDLLFRRITEDIRYFANLYYELRTTYDKEYLIFNKLLDQNQQYLLLLSNLVLHDRDADEKITAIARKFDQMHVILRLLNAYDSNQFQRFIYPLNAEIRGKDIAAALREFDGTLISALEESGTIAAGRHREAKELFEYERFKAVGNKWLNFSKYILMRIDRYLAHMLDRPSFVGGDLRQLEDRFNRTGMKIHAMHLEHIYTQHPKNKALFTADGVFDETAFQQSRNFLGMVLLLTEKENLSSSDEIFKNKWGTYKRSNLIWNELLVDQIPDVYVRTLPPELQSQKIEPTTAGVFPLDKVEQRQRVLFAALKLIWGSF